MESNKILCVKCGKEMKTTDKFCTSCGNKNEQSTAKPAKNKKLFLGIGIAAAVLLIICLLAPTVSALMMPTNYVRKSINNTFNSFNKDEKKFADAPTLLSLFSDTNGNTQKELYLKIDDINADILEIGASMLDDYGINLKLQSNKDNTSGNLILSLMDEKNEIVSGRIFYDKQLVALEVPKLCEDIFGVNIETKDSENNEIDENGEINEDDELREFYSAIDMLSESLESSKKLRAVYTEIAPKYIEQLIELASFKKDKSDKNLYTATINGEEIILLVTDFLTELLNNEDFKDYLATSMYISEGQYSKEYYIDMIENMAVALPDEIDYMLEEIEIGDLVIDVVIEKKAMVSIDASFSMSSNGETFKIKYAMDYIDEKDNKGIDFSLKFGSSNYDSIEGSLIYSKDDKNLDKNISFDVNIAEMDSVMSFDFVESLKEDKKYESTFAVAVNDGYDDINIELNAKGSYKNKDRIDYEDIELSMIGYDETIKFNFSGYALNSKIKTIDAIDSEKVIYIDELDEQDFDELYEEIIKNLYLLMRGFGGII